MRDILERLEHEPSYWLHSDERQMRRDAADEIRALRKQAAELEALRKRVAQLERKVDKLEAERDKARAEVVEKHINWLFSRNNLYYYRHKNALPSDSIANIRRGNWTLAQAVQDRNARWPIFEYEEGNLSLADAYQMAVGQ